MKAIPHVLAVLALAWLAAVSTSGTAEASASHSMFKGYSEYRPPWPYLYSARVGDGNGVAEHGYAAIDLQTTNDPSDCGRPWKVARNGIPSYHDLGDSSYGYYLKMRQTANENPKQIYAHLERGYSYWLNGKSKGMQGDYAGRNGTTGYSTGCHLHFENWNANGTRTHVTFSNSFGTAHLDSDRQNWHPSNNAGPGYTSTTSTSPSRQAIWNRATQRDNFSVWANKYSYGPCPRDSYTAYGCTYSSGNVGYIQQFIATFYSAYVPGTFSEGPNGTKEVAGAIWKFQYRYCDPGTGTAKRVFEWVGRPLAEGVDAGGGWAYQDFQTGRVWQYYDPTYGNYVDFELNYSGQYVCGMWYSDWAFIDPGYITMIGS